MMPGRRNTGSQNDNPEKPLHERYDGTPGQYGSNIGMWGQPEPSKVPGDGHAGEQSDRDVKFQRLQEMFKGQIDADVVYMILTASDWNVDESLEKLLEISNTLPMSSRPDRGPSLKSVADTFAASTTRTSAGQEGPPMRPLDLGGNLRSRLPSVPSTDQSAGTIPMLSPRTPSVAGLDFPAFPPQSGRNDSIQTALDALDSYANSCMGSDMYMGTFDASARYGGNGLFDQIGSTSGQTSEGLGLQKLGQHSVGFHQAMPDRQETDQLSGMSSRLDTAFNHGVDLTTDTVPYSDLGGFYSQNFQPVQTQSQTSSLTSTTMVGANMSGSGREPVSPRTAFLSAMMAENNNQSLDITNRRPVREDSKDSTTSDISRTSDLSHASEESVVDLSPGIMTKAKHPKQFLRRQNISLDPQERESLEQLIEEVIIGGVDHGVIDSDDSYTDDDEFDEEDSEFGRIKKMSRSEAGTKVTPSQLKVAAKHMKNLPPRFLRGLQAAQTTQTAEEGDESEGLREVMKDEQEVEERKTKKRSKGLLHSLADYCGDDFVHDDSEIIETIDQEKSPSSPRLLRLLSDPVRNVVTTTTTVTQAPSSPNPPTSKPSQPHIILRPNVVNCSDLDPERVVHTPPRMPYSYSGSGPASRDQTPEPKNRPKPNASTHPQTFSVDAPEFVPRSFHPINPPAQQARVASPVNHIREPHMVVPTAYSFSPRSGSPYTVQSVASPYPGRSGSPYHLGMGPSLSPQMTRRTMTGSPIAMVQVSTGKHSPIPPAFFIPKAPTSASAAAAAASAVARHTHAGLIPYPPYPAPHYAIPPGMRYTMPPGYRPPFLPPGGAQPRPPHMGFKFNHKERLQNSNRPNSAPTVAPGNSGTRMAANLTPQPVPVSTKGKSTPKQSTGSSSSGDYKSDKDVKEIKNLSTQLSKGSEEELEPQEKVKNYLEQGKKLMVILRGVPGSGKTHLAKELVHDGVILSTDDFFVTDQGYEFDFGKISEAHEWNQNRAKKAVEEGKNPVIIDNTNTQAWEMKFYVALAIKLDYEIEIFEPDTPWKYRAKELAKRNKHGVTKENIQRMIERFDHTVTVDSIIATSDKIKAEVEKKQRLAAAQQQQQQQQQDAVTPSTTEGTPVEEKKTKKKTRRGKGRKKKARLRELREAGANKGSENKEKTEEAEGTSEDESTPEREQSMDKSSVDNDQTKTISQEGKPSEVSSQNPTEESDKSADPKTQNDEAGPESLGEIKEKEVTSTIEDEGTEGVPENKPEGDDEPPNKRGGFASDDSGSGAETCSEPSTAESQLSQASDDEASLPTTPVQSSPTKKHASMKLHGHSLIEWVKNMLVRNLEELSKTRGPAQTQLKTLLEKYRESPEVCAEIEEIIMEKMSDGMAHKEVAEITSKARNLCLHDDDDDDSLEPQQTKNLTETDVNSIMHLLGQIKHPESGSETDNTNDGNNNNQCIEGLDDPTNDEASKQQNKAKKDTIEIEKAYWEVNASEIDPYTVGQVGMDRAGLMSQQSEPIVDQVWENKAGLDAKPRRERKRPYDRKRGKSQSDEFWTSGAYDNNDKPEGSENVSTDSVTNLSSEPNSPLKSSTSPVESGEEVQRRARRLSGKTRMAAQFPLPELEPGVKEQLMVQDWELPDFSLQEIPFSAPVHTTPRATFDVETYTHPKDFASVYRLVQVHVGPHVLPSVESEGFVRICVSKGRNINEHLPTDNSDNKASIPRKLMVDRSCSTKELEEKKAPDDVQFLQSCFSTVSEEDLSDILKQCGGEVEWAANILLDAGYEYNEKPKPKETPKVAHQGAAKAVAGNEGLCQSSPSSPASAGPLSLAQMCHQAIEPAKTSTGEVQDRMVENSVRRLSSISEFRRKRSLSGDKDVKLKVVESQLSTSSLDVFEDETDVFYSPMEGPISPQFSKTASAKSPMHGITEIPLTEESSVPQAREKPLASDMVLTLSPGLADQLIALFGPVGFHISSDSLSPSDLAVKLNRKAAKQLHRRWALTLKEKFNSEEVVIQHMIKQDEELAKKLQAEEEQERQRQEELAAAINVGQTNSGGMGPGAPPESLKEIMEEEMAIELSKKEYKGVQQSLPGSGKEHAHSLATKMKRQTIMDMFPNLDQLMLEEVYKASGYNMNKTVEAIKASLGMNEPVQNVWTPEAIQAYEDMLMRKAVEASMQEEWLGTEEGADESDGYQVLEDPQYQDIRAEASTHYRLRHECFQKAQEAYKRGLKSVATFYSQQGHIHTQKLKEANKRAAEKILELRNDDVELTNTIDLHGLHVDEALRILDELIVKRERELRQRPDKRKTHMFVVTGRGSHSRGGKAKIRPAVIDLLNRRSYNFTEAIPGMLKVMMKYRDDL